MKMQKKLLVRYRRIEIVTKTPSALGAILYLLLFRYFHAQYLYFYFLLFFFCLIFFLSFFFFGCKTEPYTSLVALSDEDSVCRRSIYNLKDYKISHSLKRGYTLATCKKLNNFPYCIDCLMR